MSFNLTETARVKIKGLLTKENRKFLRIKVVGGGCSGLHYAIAFADTIDEKTDKVFSFAGTESATEVTVLIDKKSFFYLSSTTMDYVEGLVSSGFKFINPKAKRACGCGESFSP